MSLKFSPGFSEEPRLGNTSSFRSPLELRRGLDLTNTWHHNPAFISLPFPAGYAAWCEKKSLANFSLNFGQKLLWGKSVLFFFSSKPALSCLNGIFFSPHGLDYWTSDQRKPHETPAAIDASDCLYFEIVSQDPRARAFLVCLEQPFEIWAHQTISLLALVM